MVRKLAVETGPQSKAAPAVTGIPVVTTHAGRYTRHGYIEGSWQTGRIAMALRGNHYDAAFEEFLRARRTPYVAVDEQRRALLEHSSLKSMDFIVYSGRRPNLLVDVKGRRFPSGGAEAGHKWENWATAEDLPALLTWQQVFGQDFRAVLVFAYHVLEEGGRDQFDELFRFRERTYAFYGVWADDYRRAMHTRSASWQTVSVRSGAFRELRAPIGSFL